MPGIYKVFTCLAGYRNVLRGIVLASGLVCVALGAPVIRGEEPPFVSRAESLRILVLKDGSVIQGLVTVLERGYAIDLPSGLITLPFEAVICDAASLTEAYRQQRDAMTRPTAEQHTRLANWCMQQQLFEEAERELQSALKLQPQHLPAHRLIEQLKGRKPRDSDFINKEQQQQMDDLLIKMEFSPGRPLGGLDASLAKDFATRIEPLLLNSCANASCHGQTAENSFRLTPKWNLRGNTRHITDQNLAAVLQQLDLENPERSPLIAKLDGQHGPRRMPVFTGARAAEHRKNLENWALLAARYLATQSPPPSSTPASREHPIQQTGFTTERVVAMPLPADGQPANASALPGLLPIPGNETDLPVEKDLVEESRRTHAPDPFDPARFNLRKHGRK